MMPQQYCLRWKYHHSNLQTMFSQLLDRGCFCDVTLACEGQTLRAHRVVLCACSTYFDSILTNTYVDKDPIIIMKDCKFADIECLIEFMYKGEINVEHSNLASLLKAAEDLKIKGLAEVSWRDDDGSDNAKNSPIHENHTILHNNNNNNNNNNHNNNNNNNGNNNNGNNNNNNNNNNINNNNNNNTPHLYAVPPSQHHHKQYKQKNKQTQYQQQLQLHQQQQQQQQQQQKLQSQYPLQERVHLVQSQHIIQRGDNVEQQAIDQNLTEIDISEKIHEQQLLIQQEQQQQHQHHHQQQQQQQQEQQHQQVRQQQHHHQQDQQDREYTQQRIIEQSNRLQQIDSIMNKENCPSPSNPSSSNTTTTTTTTTTSISLIDNSSISSPIQSVSIAHFMEPISPKHYENGIMSQSNCNVPPIKRKRGRPPLDGEFDSYSTPKIANTDLHFTINSSKISSSDALAILNRGNLSINVCDGDASNELNIVAASLAGAGGIAEGGGGGGGGSGDVVDNIDEVALEGGSIDDNNSNMINGGETNLMDSKHLVNTIINDNEQDASQQKTITTTTMVAPSSSSSSSSPGAAAGAAGSAAATATTRKTISSWVEQNLDMQMDCEDDINTTVHVIPKIERPDTPSLDENILKCDLYDIDDQSEYGSTSQVILTPQEVEEWKDVVRMNSYLTKGRRPQFWEEPFTKRVMEAIKTKDLEMKKAAQLLGVSYGTLYGRYRETYGCLKNPFK